MSEILLGMISGLAINLITRLSGKLGVSKTYVSVGLCLFIGVLMYFGQTLLQKFPAQRESIYNVMLGSYGFSQIIRNTYKKICDSGKQGQ